MEHKNKVTREVDVLSDVTCDCCGKSCGVPNEPYTYEYMTMTSEWGYNSSKDTERWEAHICEKCVDTKFGFIKFTKSKFYK
jgi:hypothetical protein